MCRKSLYIKAFHLTCGPVPLFSGLDGSQSPFLPGASRVASILAFRLYNVYEKGLVVVITAPLVPPVRQLGELGDEAIELRLPDRLRWESGA